MEATVHFFGLWASLYKGWHITRTRKGLLSILWGRLFHCHMLLLSISLFSNDLRQVCNLLPCSPARKSDPKRIRENSWCFFLPLHRIFLSIFALARWTLVPPIFCLPVLPVARNYLVFWGLSNCSPFNASWVKHKEWWPVRYEQSSSSYLDWNTGSMLSVGLE